MCKDLETLSCGCCGKVPNEIAIYRIHAENEEISVEEYAREDGTYCLLVNKFVCDDCYEKAGSPTRHAREYLVLDDFGKQAMRLAIINECREIFGLEPYTFE